MVQHKQIFLLCFLVAAGINLQAQKAVYVKPLRINSASNEFGVFPYKNGFFYCSDVPHHAFRTYYSKGSSSPLTSIQYYSFDDSSSHFNRINKSVNNGPVCVFNNDSSLVITRNRSGSARADKPSPLNMYFYAFKNNSWVAQPDFPYNSPDYSCGHGAVNNAGNVIVFVSDMPGGYGKSDLYICYLQANGWSKPQNLGPAINTSGNELFPFVLNDSTLFFSSTSHNGKGGLDIFKASLTTKKLVAADYLQQINTRSNDYSFWCNSSISAGYFSCDQQGNDDVFSFNREVVAFDSCMGVKKIANCFAFSEELYRRVDTLKLMYEWDFGDSSKYTGITAQHCYTNPGKYTVRLHVHDLELNLVFKNQAIYHLSVLNDVFPQLTVADTLLVNTPATMVAGQGNFKTFTIEKYYWNIGNGSDFINEQRASVMYDKPGVYTLTLGVTGADGNTQKSCFQKKVVVVNKP